MHITAQVHVPGSGVLVCDADSEMGLLPGETVVVEIDRCLDCGTVEELAARPPGTDIQRGCRVVRRADAADLARRDECQRLADDTLRRFGQRARETGLWLKPLAAHYSQGRERLAILFGSEDEVDPRSLAALLQPEVTAHIDFRQLGMRDEAAMIGGLGPCGRVLCCCSWQREFRAVNVRMAKQQDLPLNPAAINGVCGRLKCCLRFEFSQYCEAAARLPPTGATVKWADGQGTVVGRDILNDILIVRTLEGRYVRRCAAAVAPAAAGGGAPAEPRGDNTGADDEHPDRERT